MANEIRDVIEEIEQQFKEDILKDSPIYSLVDLGNASKALGYPQLVEEYEGIVAVIPLKKPKGMQIRVDGRDFVNYIQLESGIAIPDYVSERTALAGRVYKPHDRMTLCML